MENTLLTAKGLAGLLRISLRKLRYLNKSGQLPRPVRIGKSLRWQAATIQAWLDAGAPAPETLEAAAHETVK